MHESSNFFFLTQVSRTSVPSQTQPEHLLEATSRLIQLPVAAFSALPCFPQTRAIDGVIQKPIAQQAGSREKLEIPKMGKSIRCVFGFFSAALNQQKYNIHIPKAR